VPPNAATVAAAAAAAQNIAVQQQQQQATSVPLSQQLITNAQGQIVAVGNAQVTCYRQLPLLHIHVQLVL